MRRFVDKVTEKTDKLSNEQLSRIVRNLSLEVETISEENDEYRSIFESLSTGLVVVDENWNVLHSNNAAERLLNFSVFEDSSSSLIPVWELSGEEEISGFIKKCAQKNITNAQEEFSVETDGGSIRFLSVSVGPLFQENKLTGKIIFVKDITGQKNQDVLLHRMENLASLTNLAAGMAHEIKNPLGAISIHIQLVQRALEKARQNADTLPARKFVEDHIDVVNEEIEHLNSLVMDFLFAVRPVNAKLELKNPVSVINTVSDFLKPEFNRNGINFEIDLREKEARIMIDEKLFREVIVNMAQNALAALKEKYGEKGSEGHFRLATGIKDGKYIVCVTDNGSGMNEETLSKLFEPYYTTKANGTGLGMTMCYKIIKEFSGEIHVDSVVGEGTQFIITLPLPQSETKLLG